MPLEDKQMWRRVWREIAKRNDLDTSRLVVTCINNVVDLSGVLKANPVRRGLDVKRELETVKDIILALPGVREVTDRNLRME